MLNFANFSQAREVYHYSSYALAAGIPAALLFGAPGACRGRGRRGGGRRTRARCVHSSRRPPRPSSRRAPAAVSTIVDLSLGVVVPLHAHMGVRSVLLDYVHEPSSQSLALAVLVRRM